ncbi:hypothetical protein [Rhizobium sp. S9]|uniref:hypothetical protein n=1 Tax=Rhizobium sp. S9 TaxID=2035454 RepID=UPI0011421F29|nr:hypothetical protein [Rhizobium sp. S9]
MMRESNGEDSRVVARIVRSKDGGPIRRIINGRSRRRTGTFISHKAGLRAMPWDSFQGELPVLFCAEVSSGVATLLAQPHRLEMRIIEQKRPLIYFPDLELGVDDQFLDELRAGQPFASVAASPRFRTQSAKTCRKIIVEVKRDNDPRRNDPMYIRKLELANEIYRRLNVPFFIVDSDRITAEEIRRFQSLTIDRHARLELLDYDALRGILSVGGEKQPYSRVVAALGGGPVGQAKAAALQVKRVISMDLRSNLIDDTDVNIIVLH